MKRGERERVQCRLIIRWSRWIVVAFVASVDAPSRPFLFRYFRPWRDRIRKKEKRKIFSSKRCTFESCATLKMVDEMKRCFSLICPILPHPSTHPPPLVYKHQRAQTTQSQQFTRKCHIFRRNKGPRREEKKKQRHNLADCCILSPSPLSVHWSILPASSWLTCPLKLSRNTAERDVSPGLWCSLLFHILSHSNGKRMGGTLQTAFNVLLYKNSLYTFSHTQTESAAQCGADV